MTSHLPTKEHLRGLTDAIHSARPISIGLRRTASPHEFYRYPGRFSPDFARSAIEAFSEPGDLVLDPFVGGGTTAVEAALAGRRALVADINPLATFVTQVKTTPLTTSQIEHIRRWLETIPTRARINQRAPSYDTWRSAGYLRHLESRDTWRISKLIRSTLGSLPSNDGVVERFCRCIILRTGQWALDMRHNLPTVGEFRDALSAHGAGMLRAACQFSSNFPGQHRRQPIVIDAALPGLSEHPHTRRLGSPKLVVTSPPYPGVYALYHRWKVYGRKETPAPYWIADRNNSHGLSHYTMSARATRNLDVYFDKIHASYSDLARISSSDTILVQMVGFNSPQEHLPRFLEAMAASGFSEFRLPPSLVSTPDRRPWRAVPGRRWWTQAHSRKSVTAETSREVVLFHRRA